MLYDYDEWICEECGEINLAGIIECENCGEFMSLFAETIVDESRIAARIKAENRLRFAMLGAIL